jgi:hypothetical protein
LRAIPLARVAGTVSFTFFLVAACTTNAHVGVGGVDIDITTTGGAGMGGNEGTPGTGGSVSGSAGAGGSTAGAGGGAGSGGDAGSGGAAGGPLTEGGIDDAASDAGTTTPDAALPCPPLLGYWPADGNALDVVGHDDGQINGAIFGPGVAGQAFVFDGTSSVTVSRAPAVKSAGDWTYSLFIKVTTYTNGAIDWGDGSYFIDRTDSTNNLVSLKAIAGQFAFQIRYDDGSGLGGPAGGAIQKDVWTHVALVREAKVRFALYVSGALAGSVPDTGQVLTAPAFELGRHVFNEGFTGSIDELRIYDGALQLPQIQALAAGRACP